MDLPRARVFGFDGVYTDEDPTGTVSTAVEETDAKTGRIFDLGGRSLGVVPERGIYIQNNRKMIK